MAKILYTSSQVRHEIISLFSVTGRRRVAITAFVGEGAESYLPNPKGLHLICWPKAGGTNPNTIRQLMQRGAKVSFVDSLHMKLYWAEGRGAIISSANLSTNALGSGNLMELGVLLPAEDINIDRIISSLKMHMPSTRELESLDREHDLYQVRNKKIYGKDRFPSFKEWYESVASRQWKLGWYDAHGDFSKAAIAIAKRDYGIAPYDFISFKKGQFKKEDWVLSFMLLENSATKFRWMFVDYIVRVPLREKRAYFRDYPFQAVQVSKPTRYPIPPFRVDSALRRAFNKAIKEFGGGDEIIDMKSMKPPKRLVDLVYKYYA
jgi:hypothetical protein